MFTLRQIDCIIYTRKAHAMWGVVEEKGSFSLSRLFEESITPFLENPVVDLGDSQDISSDKVFSDPGDVLDI